jgi:hypothetical protein
LVIIPPGALRETRLGRDWLPLSRSHAATTAGVRVHAHLAEVMAEAWLEKAARTLIQRLAG